MITPIDLLRLHGDIDLLDSLIRTKQDDTGHDSVLRYKMFLCTCRHLVDEAGKHSPSDEPKLLRNAHEDIDHALKVTRGTSIVTPELIDAIDEACEETRYLLTRADSELGNHFERTTSREWIPVQYSVNGNSTRRRSLDMSASIKNFSTRSITPRKFSPHLASASPAGKRRA